MQNNTQIKPNIAIDLESLFPLKHAHSLLPFFTSSARKQDKVCTLCYRKR